MKRCFLVAGLLVLATGCTINREGVQISPPPAAVQGTDDAQGSPLSTPGAGMGVGSGNPTGIGTTSR